MTYEDNGKQYVVTVDDGHGSFGMKLGDYVRAYALPEKGQRGGCGLVGEPGSVATTSARFWKCLGSNNDLKAGAGLKFSERGSYELKGLPGQWNLFAASAQRISANGTFATCRWALRMSAYRGRSEVVGALSNDAFDPQQNSRSGCLFFRTAHECSITTQCLRSPAGRIESWRRAASS